MKEKKLNLPDNWITYAFKHYIDVFKVIVCDQGNDLI
jgi:hypothetical protein